MNFPAVYLLHGMGGSPNGSALQLETELRDSVQPQNYIRPLLPHADPSVMPGVSVQYLRRLDIPCGALCIGISLGGLVAAKLQELERADLHVICVSSPTYAGDTELHRNMDRRVAVYSSKDHVIAGRTERWPLLAEAYDLLRLTHATDTHKRALARMICAYIEGLDFSPALEPLR